jgi:hypothetical protein
MWLMLMVGMLTACGDAPPPPKTVFDPSLQALKKTRAVEGQLAQEVQRQREAVDQQEGKGAESK